MSEPVAKLSFHKMCLQRMNKEIDVWEKVLENKSHIDTRTVQVDLMVFAGENSVELIGNVPLSPLDTKESDAVYALIEVLLEKRRVQRDSLSERIERLKF